MPTPPRSAPTQPDDDSPDGAPSDPFKPEDRFRLDRSIRGAFERSLPEALRRWLRNRHPTYPGELWVRLRTFQERRRIVADRDVLHEACRSPLEQLLIEPLLAMANNLGSCSYRVGGREYGLHAGSSVAGHIRIEPQARIDRYEVDFLVEFSVDEYVRGRAAGGTSEEVRTARTVAMVIECDGREHHDKTREQAERDRARDRSLQALGYLVFRYPGSVIVRDPYAVARDALGALVERLDSDRDAA